MPGPFPNRRSKFQSIAQAGEVPLKPDIRRWMQLCWAPLAGVTSFELRGRNGDAGHRIHRRSTP
jgi:hypothetical protein